MNYQMAYMAYKWRINGNVQSEAKNKRRRIKIAVIPMFLPMNCR
jgi:hypothetical protein